MTSPEGSTSAAACRYSGMMKLATLTVGGAAATTIRRMSVRSKLADVALDDSQEVLKEDDYTMAVVVAAAVCAVGLLIVYFVR